MQSLCLRALFSNKVAEKYICRLPVRNLYLISRELITDFERRTGFQTELNAVVNGHELNGLMYRSCIYSDIAQPLLSASHVTTTTGTGLVHTCYGHGFDDYKVCEDQLSSFCRFKATEERLVSSKDERLNFCHQSTPPPFPLSSILFLF